MGARIKAPLIAVRRNLTPNTNTNTNTIYTCDTPTAPSPRARTQPRPVHHPGHIRVTRYDGARSTHDWYRPTTHTCHAKYPSMSHIHRLVRMHKPMQTPRTYNALPQSSTHHHAHADAHTRTFLKRLGGGFTPIDCYNSGLPKAAPRAREPLYTISGEVARKMRTTAYAHSCHSDARTRSPAQEFKHARTRTRGHTHAPRRHLAVSPLPTQIVVCWSGEE